MPRLPISTHIVKKSITITKEQNEIWLPSLLTRWGFTSESEIIRAALTMLYRKYEPKYLEPSPYMKDREKQRQEEDKLMMMTSLEYVQTRLNGVVLLDKDGVEHVIVYSYGNRVRPIPLTMAKDYFIREYPEEVALHLERNALQPIEEFIKHDIAARQHLNRHYNFDLSIPESAIASPQDIPEVDDDNTPPFSQADSPHPDSPQMYGVVDDDLSLQEMLEQLKTAPVVDETNTDQPDDAADIGFSATPQDPRLEE